MPRLKKTHTPKKPTRANVALTEKFKPARGQDTSSAVQRVLALPAVAATVPALLPTYERAVAVTPAMAAKWLETMGANRSVSDAYVEEYANDMRAGKWMLNGETLKFDSSGRLRDVQHRLWGVVMANVTVLFDIARNVDPEAMKTMDTGRGRSMANVLQIMATAGNSQFLAGGAAWRERYDRYLATGSFNFGGKIRFSHDVLLATLQRHPSLYQAAIEVPKTRASRLLAPGLMTMVYAEGMDSYPVQAQRFAEDIGRGIGLTRDNPAYALREKMTAMRGKGTTVQNTFMGALTIKAWNAYAKGKKLSVLRMGADEPFPTFVAGPKAVKP